MHRGRSVMVRRIEPVCANCKHLRHNYKSMGMAICHTCEVREKPEYIEITRTWAHTCEKWEVKQ